MKKQQHEIRDPIHNFVRISADEIDTINSRPVQRLRHIHQLALTYLVYPGATHRRFEHSLGVMELAGRVFDVITDPRTRHPDVAAIFPDHEGLVRWRKIVRLAALLHDVGHLPFSHAAETTLLPEGKQHEWLTMEVIRSDEMRSVLGRTSPAVDSDQVAKIAVGPAHWKQCIEMDTGFDEWEFIMTEIVTGNAFGADRMDYLLRDSHHAGVAYGRFDHYRLIDTLRIARHPRTGRAMIGIEKGGVHAAEALQLARQFMFLQLYYHPVRIAYDIHLTEFMRDWLATYPTRADDHLRISDNEVLCALRVAADDPACAGHMSAARIHRRAHFRKVYERNAADDRRCPNAVERVAHVLQREFGEAAIRQRRVATKDFDVEFPVLLDGGEISTYQAESRTYIDVRPTPLAFVFAAPETSTAARDWLATHKTRVLSDQITLDLHE